LVAKGFLGTWDITNHFCEVVVVEIRTMMKAEVL
jgi:hypothetical protein